MLHMFYTFLQWQNPAGLLTVLHIQSVQQKQNQSMFVNAGEVEEVVAHYQRCQHDGGAEEEEEGQLLILVGLEE